MHRFLSARTRTGAVLLALAGVAHAGSTITVNTAANTIDFAATGNGATTLVRPAWDMTPQAWNSNQASPSSGVWVPGSGAPTVAQLVTDLATRGDSKISLREAIAIANATQYAGSETGPTTLVFDTAAMGGSTITLNGPENWWYGTNALPPIYADIAIEGGSGVTIARANPASNTATPFRLFYVAGKFHNLVEGKNAGVGRPTNTPGKLTLRNVTLRNGLALGGNSYYGGGGAGLGGAIYNQGTLILDHATLSDHRALGGASHIVVFGGDGGGGGLRGDGRRYGGGGFRYSSEVTGDPLPSSGGGFLTLEPRQEGGAAFAGPAPGAAGTSFFGGNGYVGGQPLATNPCTTFSSGGGFIGNATSTMRGDGGGFTRHCSGGGGAFGGGGGGYESNTENVAGGGGVGGGGGQGSDGGFGGGAGAGAYGGFGGGSGYGNTVAWGFGAGGGAPTGDANPAGGGGAGLGGAVFNHSGSVSIINASQLTANIAEGGKGYGGGSGYGGALFNLDGSVVVDASTLANNSVIGGGNLGGATGNAAGGAIYSRYQDEDVGLNDLATYRGVYLTPSTTQVTLRNGAVLNASTGGVDCFADAGERQAVGSDVARLPYFHFDGAYTVGSDATGIHSCTAQDKPGVYFVFAYYDNATNDFANRGWLSPTSDFQKNLEAAGKLWAREFAAGVKLRLVVRVDANNTSPRFSASQYTGRVAVGNFSGPNGSNNVFRPGALEKTQTGASTAGVYDMLLLPNPAFVDQYYWLDPTPDNRNDNAIPAGRNDLVSVVLHELEHGFGFMSWRHRANDADFGKYNGSVTLFDSFTTLANAGNAASQSFFTGAKAKGAYSGQNLPLTYWPANSPNAGSDFDHFGTTCADRDTDTSVDARLRYALMTTCPMPSSGYVSITMPDRAVLQDLGYPMDTIFKHGFARD